MKIGVVLNDETGLKGQVSSHFGQCKFFLLAEIDEKNRKVTGTRIVPNTAVHGGGGCVAVDEILKHKVTHVIAGGMGMGAQQKFAMAGVPVFGYTGSVQKALDEFMNDTLGGLGACRDHQGHGQGGGCH